MTENDAVAFSDLFGATMPIYRLEASVQTKLLWWNILKPYPFEAVANAFSEHLRTNGRSITPADICKLIDLANPDGRPGADEAWALVPKDEASTAVITTEMSEALGMVEGLDPIAARMAFREAYTRLVDQNRRNGIPPKWFPSLGTDPAGREIALTESARLGRISQAHVAGLLPAPATEGSGAVLALVAANGILTDASSTEAEKVTARERIDALKTMLTENAVELTGALKARPNDRRE